MNPELHEATIAGLQARMERGELSALTITQGYMEAIHAIDWAGPELRSVIEINPDAEAIAAALDQERTAGQVRGPLHGIPILLKDNIDTDDRMQTTAGSLALLSSRPAQDATLAARLRAAGAIILGKANLSEWANFRSTKSSSGWSARGGQCRNPYRLTHSACGSSSGSGAAIAANLAAVALGTETDGSIVCPAGRCGIVGLKPTVGLTSRAGVVPISHSQDTIGPMTRTVADAAALLSALVGVDPRDPATQESAGRFYRDYTQFLDREGLKGARIGVARDAFLIDQPETLQLFEEAVNVLRQAGAILIDPINIPHVGGEEASSTEFQVLLYEFKSDMADYLATRIHTDPDAAPMRSMADLIAFNEANPERELVHFGQEIMLMAEEKDDLTSPEYLAILERSRRLSRQEGIDGVMRAYGLDAIVAPTGGPAWAINHETGDRFTGGSSRPAAMAGYPLISVPMGFVDGLPVGLTFMAGAYSEPTLLRLGYAYEQLTQARRAPDFG